MTDKKFILKTVQEHLSRTLPCSIVYQEESKCIHVAVLVLASNSTYHIATVKNEEIFTKPYATNFIYDQASQVLLDEVEFTLNYHTSDSMTTANLVGVVESYLGIVIDYNYDDLGSIELHWSFPNSEVYRCFLSIEMIVAYQLRSLLINTIIESLSYNFEKEKP